MSRPVTLFTGQWADLTLEELAEKCGGWGFDGLELACWGDHFDVAEALARRRLLRRPARAPRAPRPRVLGDRQPPRRPGGLRPDRRAPQGACCRRTSGATAIPRACASGPPRR